MAWIQAVPSYLTALALVLFLGLPIALALRLRGFALLAASIAGSFAVITLSSFLAPMLGLGWSIILPAVTAIGISAVLFPLGRRFSVRPTEGIIRSLVNPLVAVAVSAVLIGTLVKSGLGAPDAISQSYDNVFHLNLVQFILDGGDASPLHMTLAVPDATTQFYPNTWHATVALVAQLTGASVELATGTMIFVTACVVWPVAVLFFSSPLVGEKFRHHVTVAVVASGFTAFPYMLISWGVLYPNLLSTALIPIALGFLGAALRTNSSGTGVPPFSAWVGLAGALLASTAAHPNALFGFAALGLPLVIARLPSFLRSAESTGSKMLRAIAALLPFVAIGALWLRLGTGDNGREFEQNPLKAVISALTNSPLLDQRAWFLTVLVLGGMLFTVWVKEHRWLVGSYLIAVGLYVVASGFSGPLRTAITGLWYNDAHRLAALIPIVAVPLAAILLARVLDLISAGAKTIDLGTHLTQSRRAVLASFLIVVVLAATAFGLRGSSMDLMVGKIHELHTIDENARLISTNEITLMEEAREILPEDAVIAGNPWNGSALAYTFADRNVVFPHLGGQYGKDALQIAKNLKYGGPQACAAAERLGVTHVLDMGKLYSVRGDARRHLDYPGLTDVAGSPVLTPLLSEGDATLYEFNGC